MIERFQEMELPGRVLAALQAMGFAKPTPIQSAAVPIALTGADLIGCAQTGTGKTAAFCLPILARLLEAPRESALVLTPTRELALQISAFWRDLTRSSPEMHSSTIIGGVSMVPQARALARNPRFVVATPGRLIDHLDGRGHFPNIGTLVLDEADRMLDMGFAPQLAKIVPRLPVNRQTLLFTATWAPELDRLALAFLRSPKHVSVGPTRVPPREISQAQVSVPAGGKNDALLDELGRRSGSVLVFARTQRRADRLARFLANSGESVARIHGGRTQGQRNQALLAFREGRARVLVATDIAARGIDIAEIAHVINFDLPRNLEDYLHRIGRTGRAGMSGEALTLVAPEDRASWRQIARAIPGSPTRAARQAAAQEVA